MTLRTAHTDTSTDLARPGVGVGGDHGARNSGAAGVAAALLAAAVACGVFGLTVVVAGAVPAITDAFSWWSTIGPLGGQAVVASAVYAGSWLVLHRRMTRRSREPNFSRVTVISFSLIATGLVLTFPPVWSLLLILQEALF